MDYIDPFNEFSRFNVFDLGELYILNDCLSQAPVYSNGKYRLLDEIRSAIIHNQSTKKDEE